MDGMDGWGWVGWGWVESENGSWRMAVDGGERTKVERRGNTGEDRLRMGRWSIGGMDSPIRFDGCGRQ